MAGIAKDKRRETLDSERSTCLNKEVLCPQESTSLSKLNGSDKDEEAFGRQVVAYPSYMAGIAKDKRRETLVLERSTCLDKEVLCPQESTSLLKLNGSDKDEETFGRQVVAIQAKWQG